MEIRICWGVACDSISEQLKQMSIKLANSRMYDKIKEHINFLAMTCVFTDSQITKLYQRAQNKLISDIEKYGELI